MNLLREIKQNTQKLKQKILIIYLALKDKRTPIFAKIIIGLTISYALSPIDLIPDFIPVLGFIDDLIILPLMIFISYKLIPNEILEDCRIKVHTDFNMNKKLGVFAEIIIILIWITLAGIILFKVFKLELPVNRTIDS